MADIEQSNYNNDQSVDVSVRSVNRLTGELEPNTALKIGFEVRGYKWFEDITTDNQGTYTYSYKPTPGLSGKFLVWAAHPDVFDTLNQDSFKFYRVYANPSRGNIRSSKADTLDFVVELVNPGDESVTSLSLQFRAYTVDDLGVEVDVTTVEGALKIPDDWQVNASADGDVKLSLTADADAPTNFNVEYSLLTDKGANAVFTAAVSLSEAIPLLDITSPTTGYIDTSLNRGSSNCLLYTSPSPRDS